MQLLPSRLLAILLVALTLCVTVFACSGRDTDDELIGTVERIEARLGARVGVAIRDLETKREWHYRAGELFPLTSTFKTLACAALLHRVDKGLEHSERRVTLRQTDLVAYSPITEERTGPAGISLFELCGAAMSVSDNTAANIILQSFGGPAALTQFLRSVGDRTTRLDRWETELNQAAPGDVRDTTTPATMAATLERLVLGDILSPPSRQILKDWLVSNQVADALLRAGVPRDWIVADRTGAGGFGSRAITAVMWPPARKPIVAAIYITETAASLEARNDAIAEIGAALSAAVIDQRPSKQLIK